MSLFSLQGYIKIGKRLPNGRPGPLFWAGNVPEATLDLSVENATKAESFTGSRGPYGKMKTGQTARFTGTFDEWLVPVLALQLHSRQVNTATGTVTGETFPADLVEGDQIRLDHPYASDLVLTDNTGTPAVLAPEDFRLVGHNDAVVELLNLGTYEQPFSAAYEYAAYSSLEFFSEQPEEVYVVGDFVNTETGQGVIIDMYRASFDPVANLGLIHAEYGSLPFGADILLDPLNLDANGRGGYVRMAQKAAT